MSLGLPTLLRDFRNSIQLGAIDTFSRSTQKIRTNRLGQKAAVPTGGPSFNFDPTTRLCQGIWLEGTTTNLTPFSCDWSVTQILPVSGGSGTFIDGETVTTTGGFSGIYRAGLSTSSVFVISQGNSSSLNNPLTGATSGATRIMGSGSSMWIPETGGVGSLPVVTPAYALGPDGLMSACRVQFALNGGTTSNDRSEIGTNITSVVGQPTAAAVWIRKNPTAASSTIRLDFNGVAPDNGIANFVLTDTWQRIEIRRTNAPATSYRFKLRLRGTTGTSDAADVLVWNAQQETMPAVSSDIINPNSATPARSPDSLTIPVDSWFNNVQGTIYFSHDSVLPLLSGSGVSCRLVDLSASGYNEYLTIYGNDQGGVDVYANHGAVATLAANLVATGFTNGGRGAFSFDSSGWLCNVYGTATSGTWATGMPALSGGFLAIGSERGTASFLGGCMRKVAFWPVKATAADLAKLVV